MNISGVLALWYANHKRALPWRETKEPYKIWLSEIILQQTRVNQGIDYYYRFIERYPTVGDLARAPLDEVLKSWQGLGYYTRARNLHKTARHIYYEQEGKFPGHYEGLLKLPGIGPYTASAIASFCFGQVVAVVDGNVGRVLARLKGIATPVNSNKGKKELQQEACQLIPSHDPATHNQAMIEFGALQCTPGQPDCPVCPLKDICHAWQHDQVDLLPVKAPKRKKRLRYFYYIDIHFNGSLLLHKRSDRDIWNSLYQFPLIEPQRELSIRELGNTREWQDLFAGLNPQIQAVSPLYSHVLTHQKILARFIRVHIQQTNARLEQGYRQISPKQLPNLAVPRLIDKYLEQEKYPKNG